MASHKILDFTRVLSGPYCTSLLAQSGPMAVRPAYDIIVQAMSGIMSVTGKPSGPPTLVGESVADVVSGLFASWAILAALNERHVTGLGQHLDVSMLSSMLTLQPLVSARLFASGDAHSAWAIAIRSQHLLAHSKRGTACSCWRC